MTDEELNTLVTRLDDMSDISRDHAAGLLDLGHKFAVNQAITAITALRAQLAEVRVERDNANEIMDDWTTLHRVIADIRDASGLGSRPMLSELACEIGQRISAANARADRAEASLAAQIEVDAGIARAEAWPDDGVYAPQEFHIRDAERATVEVIERAIRVQPHDRTALDRMLAEAEARGYELAKAEAARCGWHLRRYDLAKRDAELVKP